MRIQVETTLIGTVVSHRAFKASATHSAFVTLYVGDARLYFETAADINSVIAELTQMEAELLAMQEPGADGQGDRAESAEVAA